MQQDEEVRSGEDSEPELEAGELERLLVDLIRRKWGPRNLYREWRAEEAFELSEKSDKLT